MIETLPLHDSTLRAIEVSWANAECVVRLSTADYPDCELVFAAVSEVVITKRQPWGPSVSINTVVERAKNQYEIEMQSGDVLRIAASNISFNRDRLKPAR
jgi:hypothetical protein